MEYKIETIPLEAIDSDDLTYQISTSTDYSLLADSIKKIGLIHYPILLKKKTRFIIICGHRRFSAWHYLQKGPIQVKILGPKTPDLFCIELAISDNSLQRSLNLIEQSRAYQLLLKVMGDSDKLSAFARPLNLPTNPVLIRKISKLSKLPILIQQKILDKTISLSMALELAKLNQETCSFLLELFQNLQPGLNRQREIIITATEIALCEDLSLLQVLQNNSIQEILLHKNRDTSFKLHKLCKNLKKRRYPEISNAQEKWVSNLKKLKLNKNIKLIPPKYFESMEYQMVLNFKTIKDFENLSNETTNLLDNPFFKSIYT